MWTPLPPPPSYGSANNRQERNLYNTVSLQCTNEFFRHDHGTIRFLTSRFPPNDVVPPSVPLAPLRRRSMEDTAPVVRPGLVTTDFDNIRLAVHNIASGHATFFARCPHDYSSADFTIQAVSFDVFRQQPCPGTARGPRTP